MQGHIRDSMLEVKWEEIFLQEVNLIDTRLLA